MDTSRQGYRVLPDGLDARSARARPGRTLRKPLAIRFAKRNTVSQLLDPGEHSGSGELQNRSFVQPRLPWMGVRGGSPGPMQACREVPSASAQIWFPYLVFGFRLRLITLHPQRRDSGVPRRVTCTQDLQVSQLKHSRSSLNALTTGSKSFFPKLAHSL